MNEELKRTTLFAYVHQLCSQLPTSHFQLSTFIFHLSTFHSLVFLSLLQFFRSERGLVHFSPEVCNVGHHKGNDEGDDGHGRESELTGTAVGQRQRGLRSAVEG